MRPSERSLFTKQVTARLSSLAAIVLIGGCGDDIASRNPVSGTVMVDGQPAAGAEVMLAPTGAIEGLESLRPSGVADASGKFTLMTVAAGDGAPAGEYMAYVQWPGPPVKDERDGREMPGPDRLKGKYMKDDAAIKVTIESGSNELPPFELKSK